jgi:hypothetical protein
MSGVSRGTNVDRTSVDRTSVDRTSVDGADNDGTSVDKANAGGPAASADDVGDTALDRSRHRARGAGGWAVGGALGRVDPHHVARLMEAIAAGHSWAIWELRRTADVPIRSRLRAELRRLDVHYTADDLDGMVNDAVMAIAQVARAWRPGGAPPWVWAHRRIVGVVHGFIGVFARSLDEVDETPDLAIAAAPSLASGEPDVSTDARLALQRLARSRPPAGDLEAALCDLVSARDADVWLAVEWERGGGNRRPAVTVATQFGMTDVGVRKVVQRVRARLAKAVSDGRYPALAALPAIAGHAPPAA